MSNQPKITYHSDTTGCNYNMHVKNSHFTITAEYRSGEGWNQSQPYECVTPWRETINKFFNIVEDHINTGKWQ